MLPKSQVKVYGSHATKLCLPWSDIDLVICPSVKDGYQNMRAGPILSQIAYELNTGEHDIVLHVNYIEGASVPVVKVTCQAKIEDLNRKKYPQWLTQPISIDIT